jgi:hypothetical protein
VGGDVPGGKVPGGDDGNGAGVARARSFFWRATRRSIPSEYGGREL